MKESGCYPPGAEFDTKAPYNEVKLEDKEFEVCISQTLSKSTTILTNDYIPCIEETEDGDFPYDDISNVDLKFAYKLTHLTPIQLISELKELCQDILVDKDSNKLRYLIKECESWIEDETEVIPE